MKPTLLVLAAGLGSRYGGVKQMDPIGPSGENIIDYSVFDAIRAGFGKVVFVINSKIEKDFKEVYEARLSGKIETEYVIQEISNVPAGLTFSPERVKPWGTGHAVLVAKDIVHETFAVINADDFYGKNAFEIMGRYLSGLTVSETNYAMVGYELKNTLSENGSVSRGICNTIDHMLTGVVERTSIIREGNKVIFEEGGKKFPLDENELVSMNMWGFTPKYFEQSESYFTTFIKENSNNLKAEFYIPFVINQLINKEEASVKVLESHDKWFGVTYQEDKKQTVQRVKEMIEEGHYPESLWK
ncbi:MAG: nucleotidyltransferase [Bacteroidales bacterium]|nr:nucleotidyltransferase [Bacteroidales bacterium]